MSLPLNFDIDTVDNLFLFERHDQPEKTPLTDREATSLTISGPDGSGKSILAMHVAASYWRRTRALKAAQRPICVYVSTDLSYQQASRNWKAFGLHRPFARRQALHDAYLKKHDGETGSEELELVRVLPTRDSATPADKDDCNLHRLFDEKARTEKPQVFFLDLQQQSAGDDWQFLNRLLGLLERPAAGVPHLLIVDAVEGLEVLVGRRDAYGEARSRRSRISQLIRSAKRGARAHVVFVIEEVRRNRRLPEQFVTDTVIRLRQRVRATYAIRTIEIEKCRLTAHVRGEHKLVIRGGRGGFTGAVQNWDDPPVSLDGAPLAHMHVVESLHAWNGRVRQFDEPLPRVGSPAAKFGLPGLDDLLLPQISRRKLMLAAKAAESSPEEKPPQSEQTTSRDELQPSNTCDDPHRETAPPPEEPAESKTAPSSDERQLKDDKAKQLAEKFGSGPTGGSVTLLSGDAGTFKSRLGRQFLAAGMLRPAREKLLRADEAVPGGVAILLTTSLLDQPQLVERINRINQSRDNWKPLDEIETQFVLCRRLGVRFESSEAFVATVRSYIRRARQVLLEHLTKAHEKTLRKTLKLRSGAALHPEHLDHLDTPLRDPLAVYHSVLSARIRVVIDDLSIFYAAHPNIARDPLFLQSLMFLLKHEQVTALVIATQPGQPNVSPTDPYAADLRRLDDPQVLTWNVPFYGEKRTAVTALATGGMRTYYSVYELRPGCTAEYSGIDPELLEVDRHFALYTGLEDGNPRRVPLQVRLFGGWHLPIPSAEVGNPTDAKPVVGPEDPNSYPSVVRRSLEEIFRTDGLANVVRFEPITAYDSYASFTDLLDDSRLDHTLVLQVDEFWSQRSTRRQLRDLTHFWTGPLDPPRDEDPYDLYRPHDIISKRETELPEFVRVTSRTDAAKQPLYPQEQDAGKRSDFFIRSHVTSAASESVDRIPYLWDCGFCVARRDLWALAKDEPLPEREFPTVKDVWDALCLQGDALGVGADARGPRPSWRIFFDACAVVGKVGHVLPFHVDVDTGESLLSLLLEIWASIDSETRKKGSMSAWVNYLASSQRPTCLLRDLLRARMTSFFLAMVELISACRHLRARRRVLSVDRTRAIQPAAAERHWYSTATVALERSQQPLSILRLPGVTSTRGDWGLAVSAGSRSDLLGRRVLDILSARKMGLLRMHSGIGLPVRDVLPDAGLDRALTALYSRDPTTLQPRPIEYGKFCSEIAPGGREGFLPIRRSSISDYATASFFLRRFVARAVEDTDWYNSSFLLSDTRRKMADQLAELEPLTKFKSPLDTAAGMKVWKKFGAYAPDRASKKCLQHFDELVWVLLSAVSEAAPSDSPLQSGIEAGTAGVS